jgi:hypothetical protein
VLYAPLLKLTRADAGAGQQAMGQSTVALATTARSPEPGHSDRQSTAMPREAAFDKLEAFVFRQNASTLATVLLDLARDHPAVRERLERLRVADAPEALAARFSQALASWRQDTRYITYDKASDFGRELTVWLEQVERELLPNDPGRALALFESFIELDEVLFERADDSGGDIGDAMQMACRLWLVAASRCEVPVDGWAARIAALLDADNYGARDELRHGGSQLMLDPGGPPAADQETSGG